MSHSFLSHAALGLLLLGCFGFETIEAKRNKDANTEISRAQVITNKKTAMPQTQKASPPKQQNSQASEASRTDTGPKPPTYPSPLDVPGFHPASHVGPDDVDTWPKPVVVVLHGNYDRPEWQCETWKAVAGFYGWVLCPRGKPTPWAPKSADRWLYRGREATQNEIEAGIKALEERYPGKVSRSNKILAGFSLGAIYAPGIVTANPQYYSYLFLIEGAVDKMEKWHLRSMKKAGIKGIGYAMSAPSYRSATVPLVKKTLKLKMTSVFIDMRGSGHNYRPDFDVVGKQALQRLVAP